MTTSRNDGPTALRARIGVDIGGTFTDLVLLDDQGRTEFAKVSSTPEAPERAVLLGIGALLARGGVEVGAVDEVVHGTTVGSNTLLQRAGSLTGLLTTRGFRDVLEIGRLRTPGMFNLDWDKPTPLVSRKHRKEVDERIAADGSVVLPLDEESVLSAGKSLVEDGVESIAVCFINSYLTPAHERRAAEILAEAFPELTLSLSVDVLPESREYERTSTVVVNAYVARVLGNYLARLETGLAGLGIHAPLRVANSNGALSAVATAKAKPAFFISSGRAAGAAGAAHLGTALSRQNLVVFDMGGTTASAALIHDGQLSRLQEYEFRDGISTPSRFIKAGGYLMRVPTVDVAEVGSGAGSIAYVDQGGLLHVGPVSAGAMPGPACYGQGGEQPTVTDANLLLGYLPTSLAGGDLSLDPERARAAVDEGVGQVLGLSESASAMGIRRLVNGNMARVIRAVTVERGVDPRDFSLLAFGGSGPLHACDVAEDVGINEVIFPAMPGVFTATGMLAGDIERYFIRALPSLLDALEPTALVERMAELREEASIALAEEGVTLAEADLKFQVDLRFLGQDSQLPVDVPVSIGHDLQATLRERFLAAYQATYRYVSDDRVETVNVRLVARATRATRLDFRAVKANEERESGTARSREVSLTHDAPPQTVSVLARSDAAQSRQGPVLFESADSTIFIPSQWDVVLDPFQNLVATFRGQDTP